MVINNTLSVLNKFLFVLLLFFINSANSENVLNPQVHINGVTAEQVKLKIIERAMIRNWNLDGESPSKVIVSYEFSGKGEGSRRLRLGVDTVREEILYFLVPTSGGVTVYARLFISGVNRNGETVRTQLAADDSTEIFGGQTFGEKLQVELNQLNSSFNQ